MTEKSPGTRRATRSAGPSKHFERGSGEDQGPLPPDVGEPVPRDFDSPIGQTFLSPEGREVMPIGYTEEGDIVADRDSDVDDTVEEVTIPIGEFSSYSRQGGDNERSVSDGSEPGVPQSPRDDQAPPPPPPPPPPPSVAPSVSSHSSPNPPSPDNDPNPSRNPNHEPQLGTPRSRLRYAIEQHRAGLPRGHEGKSLGDLEEWALLGHEIDDMTKHLPENDTSKKNVENYLRALQIAAEKKRAGEDTSEMDKYFEDDRNVQRKQYAKQLYKHINSPTGLRLPGTKKELRETEDAYDDSLRALGRWEELGVAEKDKQSRAAEIAIQEMSDLRDAVNSHQPTKAAEKRKHSRIGRVAAFGSGAAIGASARLVGAAADLGSFGWSAGVGAVAGGVAAGVRAHRNVKTGLIEKTPRKKEPKLSETVTLENLSQVLGDAREREIRHSVTERQKEIWKRIGRGAFVGLAAGGVGYLAGGFLGTGIDVWSEGAPVGDIADQGTAMNLNPDADIVDSGFEPSPEPSEAPQEVPPTEAEIIQEIPEVTESQPPTAEELLQEHAGDNAEAATTIEADEGLNQTFKDMGIPKEQWSDLLRNDGLMEKLVANGDAYPREGGGFGLSHTGELSDASIMDIYEAAHMDTVEVPTVDAPLYGDLPDSYAELPDDVQEFAHSHSVLTNIPNDMTGEQLMKDLNLNPADWYTMENELLAAAPNDFYLMGDNHVGLKHSGALGVDGIKAIAAGISKQGYALAA